jgi:hypothetical protein
MYWLVESLVIGILRAKNRKTVFGIPVPHGSVTYLLALLDPNPDSIDFLL